MDPKQNFFGGRRGYHHGRLRDALVEAARSLVAERGTAGFTLAEAAKRVGVTAAAPYRHFSDRNELMGELAGRGFQLFGERLARAWDDGRPSPVEAFSRMGTAYLAFAQEEPGLYAAMFGNVQTLAAPGPGAAADAALETLRRASGAVLRAHGAPETAGRDLAFQIWAYSHGVAMLAVSGHLAASKGCDPATILRHGTSNLVEMTVRRLRGA
ncbi:MAG: TetR/AcrR family transcriptional regulator [Beijerinckiaceae bacterium]